MVKLGSVLSKRSNIKGALFFKLSFGLLVELVDTGVRKCNLSREILQQPFGCKTPAFRGIQVQVLSNPQKVNLLNSVMRIDRSMRVINSEN